MTEIIEMLWGCTSCGAKRNRGRFKECESCGAPRTPDSPEYMPDDIQSAPAITDPELLRKFEGGEDWKCKYCGSSAFRADGSCAQCGSPQDDSTAAEATQTPAPTVTEIPGLGPDRRRLVLAIGGGVAVLACVLWLLLRQRVYDVRVAQASWQATVHLERYAIRGHESFAEGIAAGAFAQAPLGQRHHHDEKLLDHYVPVPYTVNEFAGYRSESYTASEPCGQSCYSTPRTCTSNKNGSATCTGGGQHCSTRYCSVTKTRQVAYTKPVIHIRQDPVYRYEPRFAEWYSWKAWEWGPDHDVSCSGADAKVLWPPESQRVLKLGDGERQRESKSLTMSVVFAHDKDTFTYTPKTEQQFTRFGIGTRHRIRKAALGAVEVVEAQP